MYVSEQGAPSTRTHMSYTCRLRHNSSCADDERRNAAYQLERIPMIHFSPNLVAGLVLVNRNLLRALRSVADVLPGGVRVTAPCPPCAYPGPGPGPPQCSVASRCHAARREYYWQPTVGASIKWLDLRLTLSGYYVLLWSNITRYIQEEKTSPTRSEF
jgi:hypothetical protein